MGIYTTEITSGSIPSDNPVHQRLLKAYIIASDYAKGDVLEVGCGEGRGIDWIIDKADSFTALDKMEEALTELRVKYPRARFVGSNLPPFREMKDSAFDRVFSFQVIEHIQDDRYFLKEIHRVLKPGGTGLITTPNRIYSLTRNPWHVREYTARELLSLAMSIFSKADIKGIAGNKKVLEYYDRNRKAVNRLVRWDIFNLQYRLPASWLRIPYDWLNRWNRNRLKNSNDELVQGISHQDFHISDSAEESLDLLLIVEK